VAYDTLSDTDSERERATHNTYEKRAWRTKCRVEEYIDELDSKEAADVKAVQQSVSEIMRVNAAPQDHQLQPFGQLQQQQELARQQQLQQALRQKLRQQRGSGAQDFNTGAEH
jgi:hypothetical protein